MIRLSELKLPLAELPVLHRLPTDAAEPTKEWAQAPERVHPLPALRALAAQTLGVPPEAIASLSVFKRSFDARTPQLRAVFIVDIGLSDPSLEPRLLKQHAAHPHIQPTPDMRWHPPGHASADWPRHDSERPIVIGMGPCGLFAALTLAEMGFAPIVLERGQPVRQRTQDTWDLWRRQQLHAESNVQFGEGGAGLFSDGKLYSQIKDPRHLGRRVIQTLVDAGAPPEILYAAHPHVGTFKLVKVVQTLRQRILDLGGDIRLGHRVEDLHLAPQSKDFFDVSALSTSIKRYQNHCIQGLTVRELASGRTYTLPARRLILALGHSARDTFAMLWERGVYIEPKPYSVGVRIEHPQSLIDRARWGRHAGHPLLGAADYKLVHHAANGRAVYSFCMCPGGTVVAATSEPERVVTNGMSQYSRNERNANAGLVVNVDPPDYPTDPAAWVAAWGETVGTRYAQEAQALRETGHTHPLAGIVLQRSLEARAFEAGGGGYLAPAQRVGDFLARRPSCAIGSVQPSYRPGVTPGDLATVLPECVLSAMREALPVFGRRIKGFDLPDALLTGVETRTSSPLRITRGADFQSLNTRGLYPAGEGAGYAGGILSAAVDGIKVAEALAQELLGLTHTLTNRQPTPPPPAACLA